MDKPLCVIQHERHVGLGSLESELGRLGWTWRSLDPAAALRGQDSPARREGSPAAKDPRDGFDPADWAGLIVLGGAMNVDQSDEFPFLADECVWLRHAVEADLPVLGICLGAQLLAKALGQPVHRNPQREIGWYTIDWTTEAADDPVFAGLPARPHVFQWHSDTFDLPAGAVRLAESPLCRNQAFRYGRAVYGVQFHFEMTAAMIDDWACGDNACAALAARHGLDCESLAAATARHLPAMQAMAVTMLGRFLRQCRSGLATDGVT